MKIAVLGATGKTGIEVVRQALAAGHQVVALARTPAKMTLQNPALTVIQGDAMNAVDVQKTLAGTQAVINTLGHVKGSPGNLQVTVIEHVLKAMQANNIKRLVTLSGGGVRFPGDQPKFIDNVFKFLLSATSPKVIKDGEAHVEVIKRSNVEWVVVRGPRLTDGAFTGTYKVGMVGSEGMGTQASRADVADFMLKCLTNDQWLRNAPFISA